MTHLIIGLIIGATIATVAAACREQQLRRNYRHRLGAAFSQLSNQAVYIYELQSRLDRQQQRVWIYVPDDHAAGGETGPVSGIPINWN